MFVACSLGAVLALAPGRAAITWRIDSNHTSAQFSVKHLMVSTVRGTLGKVSGTVDYDGKDVRTVRADVAIDARGITTGNDTRDRDLRGEEFFEVDKYPTITFTSKRAEPGPAGHFTLVGDLTMHGVTKEVALDVEGPSPAIKTPAGEKIGASATTRLNRRDFGLNYSKMMEAIAVAGDEVAVTIDIELTR